MTRLAVAVGSWITASLPLAAVGFLCCLAIAIPAFAAPDAGTVEGATTDEFGQPLPGVQVKLQAANGATIAATASDAAGAYRMTGIAPGRYTLAADKPGFAAARVPVVVPADAGASADLTLAAEAAPSPAAARAAPVEEVTITAKRLEEARLGIEPQIGASSYTITDQSIVNQPGGENNSITQVLLQAPGTTQDNLANGGVHIRNEHLNVQYRINGIILPEGVSFFGQGLTPRFVSSLQLITGALPAEYGLRTAGIVDIQTKSGLFAPGGSVGIYGGSYATIQPSAEYGGSAGSYNYYISGDYLRSNHGIDAVTPSYNQIHDATQQGHAFGYLDKIIDSASKVSFLGGSFYGEFQIPNNPNQTAVNFVNGRAPGTFDSATLNENQVEQGHFGVASYLRSQQDLNFQVSAFTKYSELHFFPDTLGDLAFNGVSQNALRRSIANGVQADGSYKLLADHTLRAGMLVTEERINADTLSLVETTGAATDTAFSIEDNHAKTGFTYSAYLQDEWRLTPAVTVNFGGRFDEVNTLTTGNQISPRVNVVWRATSATTLHAGYASYFTPPPMELVAVEATERFANTTNAPASSCPCGGIKPERAHYFDVGIAQDVLPGLKVGLDAYYKYSRNLLDEGQFGAPIVLTPFNFHVGYNKGVELSTNYVNGAFSYYGNLAIAEQKAEGISSAQFNFSADDLAFINDHEINTDHSQLMTASAGVSYLWQATRFSLDIVAGSGVRQNNGTPNGGTVPSYEQVNLGVSHRFEQAVGGPLTARVDLINVLDEIYLLRSGTGIGEFAPQFGPRRTLFLGLRKEF